MNGSFLVEVKYPNNMTKLKGAQIGGGPCTPEQLVEHYQRVNAFPGAEEVTVYPSDAPVAKTVWDALMKKNMLTEKMKAKPKVTPKIKLGKRIELKLPEEPPPAPGTAERTVEERSTAPDVPPPPPDGKKRS